MERFQHLKAVAASIPRVNIDTDQIVPARFLQKPRRDGFAQYLFHDVRYFTEASENETKRILVAGRNFGCGSSRENAVWALSDAGFRVVIAPSFGDIFFSNCLKNGLLPIVLEEEIVATALASLQSSPGQTIEVDLESQTVISPDGATHMFAVDPFAKHCLLNGIDELEYTLSRMDEIADFERRYEEEQA